MQPVSSDAPAYPDESSAKIPKTPCGTVKRAFRAAFPTRCRFWRAFSCDETFSITCSADVPPEVDHGWFYLWVTVLDWCYWVAGAAVLLHIWRRQMLLSIAGGTIVYMLLVQMM